MFMVINGLTGLFHNGFQLHLFCSKRQDTIPLWLSIVPQGIYITFALLSHSLVGIWVESVSQRLYTELQNICASK